MSDPQITDNLADVPRPPAVTGDDLSRLLVLLLKGVVHRESDAGSWAQLVTLQARGLAARVVQRHFTRRFIKDGVARFGHRRGLLASTRAIPHHEVPREASVYGFLGKVLCCPLLWN